MLIPRSALGRPLQDPFKFMKMARKPLILSYIYNALRKGSDMQAIAMSTVRVRKLCL